MPAVTAASAVAAAMSFLFHPALPVVAVPKWLAISPLLLAGGGTVARCYTQKEALDNCVKLDHEDVVQMGEDATEEYVTDYVINKRVARKTDPRVKRVCGILDRLIENNPELQDTLGSLIGKWRVNILDEAIAQSIAFPNGYVFIHEGMLDVATLDDELAFCLAHDLAMIHQRQVEDKLNEKIWKWKWAAFMMQPVTHLLHTEPAEKFVHKNMLTWKPADIIKEQERMYLDHHKVEEADRKAFVYLVEACFDERAPSSVLMKLFLQEKMDQFWKENMSTEIYRHLIADPRLRAMSLELPVWRQNPLWTSKDRWDMFSDMQQEMTDLRRKKEIKKICPKLPINDPRKEAEKWGKLMDDFMFNFPGVRKKNWTPFISIPVNLNPEESVKSEETIESLSTVKTKDSVPPVNIPRKQSQRPSFTGFGGWFRDEDDKSSEKKPPSVRSEPKSEPKEEIKEEVQDKMKSKKGIDFSKVNVKRMSKASSVTSSTATSKKRKKGYFLYYKKKVTVI